jgi:hypothetical protein
MKNPTKKFSRSFGNLISIILAGLSTLYFYQGLSTLPIILAIFALLFSVVAFKFPEILTPLSKLWLLLGELIGVCTRPIIMGFLFYLIFTPVAILARLIRGDRLSINKKFVDTYWIHNDVNLQRPDHFRKQY